jgi:hypothetical protein
MGERVKERKSEGENRRIGEWEIEGKLINKNMDCKEFEGFMMDYAAGESDSDNLKLLMSHLEVCDKCRKEYEQIKMINETFDVLPDISPDVDPGYLKDYDLGNKWEEHSRTRRYRRIIIPAGIAASVLIFISGFLTGRIHRNNDIKDNEIAALRSEVNQTKNLMILSLIKQQSPSKRIQAASYAEKMDELQPEVMDALLQSLNNDQSTNVRLASLEALSKYTNDPSVRTELIKAFDQESDPVIQVNMINLMVLLNEKSSAVTMQRLVNDDNTDEIVKGQARKGLEILL